MNSTAADRGWEEEGGEGRGREKEGKKGEGKQSSSQEVNCSIRSKSTNWNYM